jgi:hypothetical protein
VLQALGGIAGGGALAIKPHGDLLKMPMSYIEDSPFHDYRIPGLLLLLVLGIFPLVVAIGLLALASLAPSVQRDCGLRWGRRI